MGRESEGVKDSQYSHDALCSSAVYSLSVFSGGSISFSLFVPLFILLSFMFSYTIMQSKGPRGTGLSAGARTTLKYNKIRKKSKAPAMPVISSTDRLQAVFWWPFAKEQPSQSMLSFISTYGNHEDKQNVYREMNYK